MRDYFYALADILGQRLQPGETFTCLLKGETSDFIRLNKNRVRQAGSITQFELFLDLIEGQRHASRQFNVSGDIVQDKREIDITLKSLRQHRHCLNDDPYLLYATEISNTEFIQDNRLPDSATAITEIIDTTEGLDLAGVWASGAQYYGFANSFGQRNWHVNHNFNFDWSCYQQGDSAVKSNYSGLEWDSYEFQKKIEENKTQLSYLRRPVHSLSPGRYRTFLSPSAFQELTGMLSWGGFSAKSHKTLQTPLLKMILNNVNLSPEVTILENHEQGLTPCFTPHGFIKPSRVELIAKGKYHDCLVSPRSAREYNLAINTAYEFPQSLEMAPGNLDHDSILDSLENGLYINNLWYCNYSDRNNCRITGMSRYACFWVENGEIVAPINVMRFDDNIFSMLGKNLIAISRQQEFIGDASSYHMRSNSCTKIPGVMIEDLNFTL